jgi:hypothetical protein
MNDVLAVDVTVLLHDLHILNAMVAEMANYLNSDATHWPMRQEGMPKLTIGGCLMRLDRLQTMRHHLPEAQQNSLDDTLRAFNTLLTERIVRFESRAHDELYARLREWTTYLRHATSHKVREKEHYTHTVDTRLVISALIDKLQVAPYRLNPQLAQDIAQMDNYLKAQWESGEFVLPPVWREAYPVEKYWWLYGCPKA